MDDNRDRKLDLEEMKLGLQEYGANMDGSQVAELFKEIDRDGSGTVSLEEFLRAVRVSAILSGKSRVSVTTRLLLLLLLFIRQYSEKSETDLPN